MENYADLMMLSIAHIRQALIIQAFSRKVEGRSSPAGKRGRFHTYILKYRYIKVLCLVVSDHIKLRITLRCREPPLHRIGGKLPSGSGGCNLICKGGQKVSQPFDILHGNLYPWYRSGAFKSTGAFKHLQTISSILFLQRRDTMGHCITLC